MCRRFPKSDSGIYKRIDNVKSIDNAKLKLTGVVSAFTIVRETSSPWWMIDQV